MLPEATDYESLRARFRWQLPQRYNIAVDVCDRWAARDPERLALIDLAADGKVEHYSFGRLKALSNRLANLLEAQGVTRGERVGILLAQGPETAIAHLASYKLGAIALPLFTLFGPEALEYRLANAGAKALITDAAGLEKLAGFRASLPELQVVLSINGGDALDFHGELARASDDFTAADTAADDPALIIYTSGTTGPPKGALHGHRVLLGHLPGVEMPHELFPKPGDLFWTPADWAWIGGLIDVLLPSWHHGVPVLAHRMAKFDPEEAFRLMADFQVRNVFMPPTALKIMRQVPDPGARWDFRLRSIGSGGESLGAEILSWGQETFGLTINEFYGQTECNLVLSSCAGLFPVKPGAIGRPVPGHDVAIIDEAGKALGAGETGMIAVKRPDPVMFLEYWKNPEATAAKFTGDWLMTGDMGLRDDEGYFHFVSRDDDIISSGGYRIGPGEIEDCLLRHPAVALAAAVGVPDPLRGQKVKAFIVLDAKAQPSDALAKEIQDFVKTRLAAHEYPREVAFIEKLPQTATGKIMRRELREDEEG
jgi:acetyl-CoA synthetase